MPAEQQGERVQWKIEVCGACGLQLGPGLNSPTPTGRCRNRDHWQIGGVIVTLDLPASEAADRAREADRAP